jgi:UDP-N-acetylmuramoylalanine--D-glutamate ligase
MSWVNGRRFLVAGTGVAGRAAAEALLARGGVVTVLDRRDNDVIAALRTAGAEIVLGDLPPVDLLTRLDDVVVSPGFAPGSPLVGAARAAGLPVYSEPELAWRLRRSRAPIWLALTGTNGKSTATTMLAAMLRAAGLRTAALGNIGEPLVFAADDPLSFDVLAVELSSQQLYWSSLMAPEAGAWLNLAEDHLEWHGSLAAYEDAKTAIWRSAATGGTAIGNLDDHPVAAHLTRIPGRAVGVTLAAPKAGQLGVADGVLVDRAFGDGVELAPAVGIRPAGAHNVSNALHAAALARSYGVAPEAIAAGLAGYVPEPHRNALVSTVDGVEYVDDSKATNPHAAAASLLAYPRIIWIAGGQLKNVDVSDLVAMVADRLAGAVLLGVDRGEIGAALARHAPDIRVIDVARRDDGAMVEVVRAAAMLARPGDTVLLAPAAASKDMYISYTHRGDAFAAAVRALERDDPGDRSHE